MNKVVRKNLRVKLGDVVSIHNAGEVPYGKAVHILPFEDSIQVRNWPGLKFVLSRLPVGIL
jgi:hypothetical protein